MQTGVIMYTRMILYWFLASAGPICANQFPRDAALQHNTTTGLLSSATFRNTSNNATTSFPISTVSSRSGDTTTNTKTTSSSSTISSTALGEYVALGIGVGKPDTSTSIQSAATSRSAIANATIETSPLNSSTVTSTSTAGTSLSNSTAVSSTVIPHTKAINGTSKAQTTSAFGNFTGGVDACWTSWSEWWDANNTDLQPLTSYTDIAVSTYTTTEVEINTYSAQSAYSESTVTTYTTTTADVENGFTQSAYTLTKTVIYTYEQSAYSASTTTFGTDTFTETSYIHSTVTNPGQTAPTPSCTLPPIVSQCDSQWSAYENYLSGFPKCDFIQSGCSASVLAYESSMSSLSRTSPSCTQASLGVSMCEEARTRYIEEWLAYHRADPYGAGVVTGAGFEAYTTQTTVVNLTLTEYSTQSSWPTSEILAPGCTVGCARCAVTGGSVRLIYWPEGTQTQVHNGTVPSTMPSDNAPRIAKTLNTTFTSPTLYISFGTVFASDSCSGVGPTAYNVIAPIAASDLSSLWATYPNPGLLSTASFNVTDLNEPVPQSIYNSQLRCAASTGQVALSTLGQTQYDFVQLSDIVTCSSTLPYEPLLVVPTKLLDGLDPAWSTCSADIRGLYDPPIALTPVNAPAEPTLSVAPLQSATPAQTPSSPYSETTQTSVPPPAVTTITIDHSQSTTTNTNDDPQSTITSTNDDPQSAITSTNDDPQPESESITVDPSTSSSGGVASVLASILALSVSSSNVANTSPPSSPSSDPSASSPTTSGSYSTSTSDSGAEAGSKIAGILGAITATSGGEAPSLTSNDPSTFTSADPSSVTTNDSGSFISDNPASFASDDPGSSTINNPGSSTISDPGSFTYDDPASVTSNNPGGSSPAVPQATFSIDGKTYTASSGSPVVVAGATLTPNQAITVSGQLISVVPGGIVVGGSTVSYEGISGTIGGDATFTLDSQTYTVNKGQPLTLSGATLRPGQTATVAGVIVENDPSAIVVGESTIGFSPTNEPAAIVGAGPTEVVASFTASGTPYTAYQLANQPGILVINNPNGSQVTFSVGGPAVTLDGVGISAASSGVVVSDSTRPFRTVTGSAIAAVTVTASSSTFIVTETPGATTAIFTGADGTTTTLTLGGQPVTVAGESVSLASGGLLIGGSMQTWSTISAAANGQPLPTGVGPWTSASSTGDATMTTETTPAGVTATMNRGAGVPDISVPLSLAGLCLALLLAL